MRTAVAMKISFAWFILFLVFLVGCVKISASEKEKGLNKEAFHNRNMGASAREFLSDEVFTSLTVEIQYMPGFKPEEQAIANIDSFLKTYLNKPDGINTITKEIPAVQQTALSKDEVLSVERANRAAFASKDRITLYLLFTNGTHPENQILGMAYRNTSAVIYGKSIHDNSDVPGKLTRAELETSVALHEIGHLLGLVNKGSQMASAHNDRKHQDHCSNKKCLMYFSTETRNTASIPMKGHVPRLDAKCIADLRANGGKNEAYFTFR